MTIVAVCLAVVATLLLLGNPSMSRLRALPADGTATRCRGMPFTIARSSAGGEAGRSPGWRQFAAIGGAAWLVAWLVAGSEAVAPTLAGATLCAGGWRLARLRVWRRREAEHRASSVRAAELVAGELRIGRIPAQVLPSVAEECPSLEQAAATQAIGGDAAGAMRAAASTPGAEALGQLAMAWELSERTGAPIGDLVIRIADGMRADEVARGAVLQELAGPRASSRMIGLLPVIGVLMGIVVGADPLGFLFGTPWGQASLLAAASLEVIGLLWIERLIDQVDRGAR